ncbi:NAD-dependent epimerase/dehydratase family protein [Roseococcus sp. DSY-14]|uniref:NAD-dependent epimerase/dehydratase family protein n=1 Tax=Roseococcus sp. DSY-14 TaxID=3369650 RepID=UPI00387AFE7D
MKVFVSGIAGFLGSHLAERILAMGHQVAGCDTLLGGELLHVPPAAEFHQMDCRDHHAMRRVTEGCELVFHCAATAYEGLSVFSPALVMDNVVSGSVSLFSAAIANGARRIVFCSSMARYGAAPVPFAEAATPRPQDPYGIAKLCAEDALRNLCAVHGVEWAVAVPHNIIGPRQKFDDPYRNVASIMANLMLQGRAPIIYGDGEQRRCFSHVEDCLSCLLAMGFGDRALGEVVNIGPDEEFVSINRLAGILAKLTNFAGEPIHVPDRPQEVKLATCSADKARRLLGYRTTMGLEEGLATVTDHIRKVGPRPFRYHLPIEIRNARTPRTWAERMF